MNSDRKTIQRVARAGFAAIACAVLAACASGPGASAPLPADGTLATGRIVGKQYLTTVSTNTASSSGPTVGVGGGGIGGNGWNGVGGGAGLSFDLTNLFQKAPEQTAKIYRYSVQMKDGSKRDIDSPLDLNEGACVTTIDSSQPGYPRLTGADAC
ncbi:MULTISPECIES: hypothetical protein [Caballeronia]|uniref:hypothetical protein n=1 Tax=Caballeronia TaxID=1827195 RepID=UPI00158875F4|nr:MULTISPECIES: hypothetical protein [Caballeronia]MCG7401976.1 hypothetical protein [Caballeronia zhejiangensis]MCI1042621.1 hypothetical protein [Caballeronia zhejiangensis]MDR5797330.1 hypothetical protein [Caballeronia sp. LZ008]